MLSNIRSRALAKVSSFARPRQAPNASISISSHDGGVSRSSRKTSSLAGHPPSLANQPRRISSQMMYSSLTNGFQTPHQELRTNNKHSPVQNAVRTNFSYAGPRKLSDVLKTDLLEGKSSAEISDLWMTYHEGKDNVHGLTIDKAKGKTILSRAAQCPFFIHPVFREEGHFMIFSQFQTPNYFLLALLEDYQMDPARAQPLLTISIFDDLAEEKDLTLVRCDIVNRGIQDDEGYKICKLLLDDYEKEEDFRNVHTFNKKPDAFDVDGFVKEKGQIWKGDEGEGEETGDGVIDASGESK